jgi:hypothetical protein
MDPRDGLNNLEKRIFLTLLGLELQPLGHPARSQSLYRLRYLSSYLFSGILKKTREHNILETGCVSILR